MEMQATIEELWDFSDPARSEEVFRGHIERTESESRRAELTTQVARTYGLRTMFDEAHALLDEVAECLPRTEPVVEVRYLLERGRAWNSAAEKERARQVFLHALDAAKRVGDDYLTVDAAHMLGIVDDTPQALEWNLLGLRITEHTKQERARHWIGPLANNIAWAYHDAGDFESALAYFEKGRDFRAIEAKEPGYRIAQWAVARCKRSMGRVQEALDEQLAISERYFPSFDPAKSNLDGSEGYVAEEIAECLLALGRIDEAKPYFGAAHTALSRDEWLAKNEHGRITRLSRLSS